MLAAIGLLVPALPAMGLVFIENPLLRKFQVIFFKHLGIERSRGGRIAEKEEQWLLDEPRTIWGPGCGTIKVFLSKHMPPCLF